jgi:hypothetical protein
MLLLALETQRGVCRTSFRTIRRVRPRFRGFGGTKGCGNRLRRLFERCQADGPKSDQRSFSDVDYRDRRKRYDFSPRSRRTEKLLENLERIAS